MGSINDFVVTEELLKGWITRYGETPICRVCREPLKVGELIETKNSGRVGTRRIHEDCLYSTPIARGEETTNV